jgi:hypothetical protein
MAFIEPTWNIWKDTASDIWRDISSKFVDTMEKAWTKIKAMFAVGWAEFRASAWEAAASAAEALGDTETARRMRVTAASERRLGQAQANRFQFVGDREAQERASQDISDWFTEMALRVERDTAAESGNTEEVARLQGQLDSVAMEAWFAARIAEVNRQMGSVETGGGVGESAAGKFKVAGGFNAAALMGALGSFGGETPQERAARLLQEANRIAQRAVDLAQQQVREISRLVFTAS